MNQSIALGPAEIHLWLADYDDIVEESMHMAYRRLLSHEERAQEPKFYFERDRRRYLVTRALVRTVLSRYFPVDPKDWIFEANAYGCPYAANPRAKDAGLSFNISHTHSMIVLGVTAGRALGVDVENFRAREVSMGMADRYFSPLEAGELARAPSHRQQYRFFEYWTFKEAYIKARGMGLQLPLDKFSFNYPDDARVEIAIDRELADDPARWRFWQLRPAADYLLAVCAERLDGPAPKLIVRQAVPLSGEKTLALEFVRASE
jgi:4'-phosphopantetheinyl transferase